MFYTYAEKKDNEEQIVNKAGLLKEETEMANGKSSTAFPLPTRRRHANAVKMIRSEAAAVTPSSSAAGSESAVVATEWKRGGS